MMKTLRAVACFAAVALCAACSSKGDSSTSPEGAADAGDSGALADGGVVDAGNGTEASTPTSDGGPQACTNGGECPSETPCCMRMPDGGAICSIDPQVPQACLCQKGSDCTSQACAPAVDSSGKLTGPYVCVPDDGSPYRGCVGDSSCTAPYCCVTDKSGNQFCSMPCSGDSTCGSGHCDAFSASSCSGGTKACGI